MIKITKNGDVYEAYVGGSLLDYHESLEVLLKRLMRSADELEEMFNS